MKRPFSQIAAECAEVVRLVLVGEIETRAQLKHAWPPEANSFDVLVCVYNDIHEYWALEPGVPYRDMLLAAMRVLRHAPEDPVETEQQLEREVDREPD